MVRKVLIAFALMLLVTASFLVEAKHFRWASQGDAATMDPHSQNETFNNMLNGLVYEYLVDYGKDMSKRPVLAESWVNTEPTKWVFKLRRGVKWHDGSPFTADDVVFSFNRARESTVTFKLYATQCGVPRKIDDHTVEFTTPSPNPTMLDSMSNIFIMSKAWSEKNNVTKPLDYNKKEETYATRNAMGTGAYRLVSWEQGVKLSHKKNPDWWGIKAGYYDGNIETVEFRPIQNAATRMAALRSGQVDFVIDPSVQDVISLRNEKDIRIWEGPETRIIYIGFDQARAELMYSDVKGKNPFKDRRVRLALYQAIDINALKSTVMRGMSRPTGIMLPNFAGAGVPASMDVRYPFDLAKSKQLLNEAGFPNGFGFTLTCPNDRYINDEKLCVAIAGMWAKIGVKVKVETMTKSNFFPKVQNRDASAFLAGWGGGSTDAIVMFKPVVHSRDGKGSGDANYGDAKFPAIDDLIDKFEVEMNPAERQKLINATVKMIQDEVHTIPLHTQVVAWASRRNISVVHRPNNNIGMTWIKVN